ncbi:MAG: FHA domain-containing protein [Actinomycetota bacterium]|nr:FHA domain-containing protein [Actinomycetota bacterium]
MSVWVFVAVILVIGMVVARRWLPDRSGLADTAYDCYRALVPAPRPTVRVVTRRMARVCRRQRVVMPFGQKAVLPRAFVVGVSPAEYDVVEPLLDTVQEAVAASLLRIAREKQWLHDGPPHVLVQPSETVAEGRPEVISTTLPAPRPAPAANPTPAGSREATLTVGPDLLPEPTASELPAPGHAHRLRTADGEPDIVVATHTVVVGRSTDCQVTIAYPSASRRHLRLTPTAAGCRLEDLDSRHGTRVNSVAVHHPVLLRAQDTVQIGTRGPTWTYLPSYGAVVTPPLREVR